MIRTLSYAGIGAVPYTTKSFVFDPITTLPAGPQTLTLDMICWVLSGCWPRGPAYPSWSVSESRETNVPWLRVIWGEAGRSVVATWNWDPVSRAWTGRAGLPPVLTVYARGDHFFVFDPYYPHGYPGLASDPLFQISPDATMGGLRCNNEQICNGAVKDLVSWQNRKCIEYETFHRVLRHLGCLASLDKPVRVDRWDRRDIPTLGTGNGYLTPVTLLGSRQWHRVALAYILTWAWSEHQTARAGRPPCPLVVLHDHGASTASEVSQAVRAFTGNFQVVSGGTS